MQTYSIAISGATPLLMHPDNIEWADQMDEWRNAPENKPKSRSGDDRSPAFRWIGNLYHDGQNVAIPSDNIMRSLMEAGASVPVPGGKGGKTFKSQTQSGMMCGEPFWPVFVGGKEIQISEVDPLRTEEDFHKHKAEAQRLGFELFVKRAKVGTNKHVRVRPLFRQWSASGTIVVWDDQITEQVLNQIIKIAGQYKGLGDWRPSGRTPGPYGTFTAEVRRA